MRTLYIIFLILAMIVSMVTLIYVLIDLIFFDRKKEKCSKDQANNEEEAEQIEEEAEQTEEQPEQQPLEEFPAGETTEDGK